MPIEELIVKGESLFAEGELDRARECFLDVLAQEPANSEALNNLGVLHYAKSEMGQAEKYFLDALKDGGDNLSAIVNLAEIYLKTSRWVDAEAQLNKYLAIDSDNVDALNHLAVVYLETGKIVKAVETMGRSLQINPAQEQVAASFKRLSASLSQQGQESAAVAEKTEHPLNILFVQEFPCIRNYKMAVALRGRGHRVSLAYSKAKLSQVYKELSDDVYDECIQLSGNRHLWDICGDFDVVHCHNEPDVLTVNALGGSVPVIHDTHDLISLRDNQNQTLTFFEGLANRAAAGRVYSTEYQLNEAQKLYDVRGLSLVFHNYVCHEDLPTQYLEKLSKSDGKVHIVYEGGIGGPAHRDFTDLFVELARNGVHIHIYPAAWNPQIAAIFEGIEGVHYNQPLSPKKIMEQMTQYDFGIIPFNLEKANKRFLDSTIANKLFEYQAAGLPVIASPLTSYVDYFKKNPVGITYKDAADIIARIPDLQRIARDTDWSKRIFTCRDEIHRLEEFYGRVIDESSGKREDVSAKVVPGEPCRICGCADTELTKHLERFSVLHCKGCDGYFVDPPVPEEFLKNWYSQQAKEKRWGGDLGRAIEVNHQQNEFNYEHLFGLVQNGFDCGERKKVLEVGCHDGLFLKRFHEAGCDCKGIDLNEGFLRYGREHYSLDLECGTIFDFDFPDESFDLIVFNQLLEHLPDPRAFLAEVKRVLKKDGSIFLSVPNTSSTKYVLERKYLNGSEGEGFLDFPNHLFYFSKKALGVLLKEAGFDICQHCTYQVPDNVARDLVRRKCDENSLALAKQNVMALGGSDSTDAVRAQDYFSEKVLLNGIIKAAEVIAVNSDNLSVQAVLAVKSPVTQGRRDIDNSEYQPEVPQIQPADPITQPNAKTVVFVKRFLHARMTFLAKALKATGNYRCHLATIAAPDIVGDVFDSINAFTDAPSLLAHLRRLNPHVIIAYDLPNGIPATCIKSQIAPVIYAVTDSITGNAVGLKPEYIGTFKAQDDEEQFNFENADAVFYKGDDITHFLDKYNITCRAIRYDDYPPDAFIAKPQNMDKVFTPDSEIHLCDGRGVTPFGKGAKDGILNQGGVIAGITVARIHLHMFIPSICLGTNDISCYQRQSRSNPLFHFHQGVTVDRYIQAISGYDMAIRFANTEKFREPGYGVAHTNFTTSSYAALAAGLPIATNCNFLASELIKHGIGIKVEYDQMDTLRNRILELDYPQMKRNVQKFLREYNQSEQILRMASLIDSAVQNFARQTQATQEILV